MTAPGLLISAPSSGTGKTTVMLGLLRALKERGLKVQPFKSGPDYIDPAFHEAAAAQPSFNLDTWSADERLLGALCLRQRALISLWQKGQWGFMMAWPTEGKAAGSSAETAIYCGWPVVLVLDVSGQAQSAAATALGFKAYAPELNLV